MIRTRVLPALMAVIGIALIVRTIAAGLGVWGIVFGVLLLAAGAGRLYVETHR